MAMFQNINIFVILVGLCIVMKIAAAPTDSGNPAPKLKPRLRRFGPMSGGMSQFRMPGGMGGAMNGPHAPGMNPSMGGPSMGGAGGQGAGSMFRAGGCNRRDIVCPPWCLVVDEFGCKSCPCGPAGGMSAMAGGPSGGPMGMSQMSGPGSHGMGGFPSMGGGAHGGGGGPSMMSGGHGGGGAPAKPAKHECMAKKLCMEGCKGQYVLGAAGTDGCQTCTCHAVQKPYQYPIEIAVEPPPYVAPQPTYALTCSSTLTCTASCSVGYQCGVDGCPTCACIHPTVVGLTSVQTYIEKPVACRTTLTCSGSCNVGYKCGPDGCPTCECVVAVSRPQYTLQTCTHTLTCASTCTTGYQLQTTGGGCPKCYCKPQVVYAVQRPKPQYTIVQRPKPQYTIVQRPKPQYTIVRCPSTDCSSRCPYGYEVSQKQGACPQCICKQRVVYATSGCGSSGCGTVGNTQVVYATSTGCGNGGCGTATGNTGMVSGSSVAYVTSGGSSSGASYSGRPSGGGHTGGGGGGGQVYQFGGGSYCAPIPPDCHPSCIKYDDPHCRRCTCKTSPVRYQTSYRGK